MKTKMVTTGIMGALAIVGALAINGCSAESGAPGEQIGSTNEALTVTALGSPHTYQDVPTGVEGAASCVIRDTVNSKDLILVFGGYSSARESSVTNDIKLFDIAAKTWISSASINALSGTVTARARAKMFQDPNNTNKCFLIGGQDASATPVGTGAHTLALSFSASKYTLTATAHTGFTARGGMDVLPCGSGKLIAIGGFDSSGALLSSNTVQVFDGTSTWTQAKNGMTAQELGQPRQDFGAIKDPESANSQYLVAGGLGSGGPLGSYEIIKAGASCADNAITVTSVTTAAKRIDARDGLSVFPEGHAHTFIAVGGYASGALVTDPELIDVDWTTPGINTNSGASHLSGLTMPAGHRFPLTKHLSSTDAWVLVGGEDGSGTLPALANPIASVSDFHVTPGSGTSGSWDSVGTLAEAKLFPVAEFQPSTSNFLVLTGLKTSATFGVLSQQVQTP